MLKLEPDADQRKELRHMFAGARAVYNICIAAIHGVEQRWQQHNGGSAPLLCMARGNSDYREELLRFDEREQGLALNVDTMIFLRDRMVMPQLVGDKAWVKSIPACVRNGAVADACNAHKACMELLRRGRVNHANLKFRSHRKKKTESIALTNSNMRFAERPGEVNDSRRKRINLFAYPRALGGPMPLRDSREVCQELLEGATMDCKIHWKKKTNEYYLCCPYEFEPLAEDYSDEQLLTEGRVMAIDPGNRALVSFYLADGTHGKLMHGDFEHRILPLLRHVDKMQSLAAIETNRRRRAHLWRAFHRGIRKVRHVRRDAHRVAAEEIWRRADVVLLPRLESGRLAQKEFQGRHRPFNSEATRKMLTWSHYEFWKRMVYSAARGKHRRIVWVEEGFTTKTCGLCGFVHSPGSAEVFQCPSCGQRSDRDVQAARNIFLRAVYHGPATMVPRLSEVVPTLDA